MPINTNQISGFDPKCGSLKIIDPHWNQFPKFDLYRLALIGIIGDWSGRSCYIETCRIILDGSPAKSICRCLAWSCDLLWIDTWHGPIHQHWLFLINAEAVLIINTGNVTAKGLLMWSKSDYTLTDWIKLHDWSLFFREIDVNHFHFLFYLLKRMTFYGHNSETLFYIKIKRMNVMYTLYNRAKYLATW